MKILALIPARGNSRRLPGKNIRLLGEKPLINWSIDAAKGIPEICDILVSTDDPQIANISDAAGALVPWLRPAELSTDTATSIDTAIHALNWYESEAGCVDGLLLLQPTSPYRTKETIVKALNLFESSSYKTVLAVSPTYDHPMWMLKMAGDQLVPYQKENAFNIRSQELPKVYVINGALYLISPEELREKKTFVTEAVIPLLMKSRKECIDIDTEWDFKMAEFMLDN